jgi:hypothetical protein
MKRKRLKHIASLVSNLALILTKVVLAQRSKSSAKLREKIATYHRKRQSVKHRGPQRWPRLRDIKELSQLPVYSRQKAEDVKQLLREYRTCITRMQLIPIEAETVSRALWLAVRGASVSGRTIRLWLARERAYGGPGRAPIKSYADAKSVPHSTRTGKLKQGRHR